jgi:hypothetical protein
MPVQVHAPDMNDVIEVPTVAMPVEEWREDMSVIASIPGRYMLANRRNLKGDRCQFACRVVNVSLDTMTLAAPAIGAINERVIVYTEAFGRLHGLLTRVVTNGFTMSIVASPATREKLAGKLAWLAKQKDSPELPDGRRHARVVPRNPMAQILLADGSTTSCLVIDFSDSGAAVSADLDPEVGTPLAIGKVIGRVVRHFTEGFAVEFVGHESLVNIERKLGSVDRGWRPSRKALRRR